MDRNVTPESFVKLEELMHCKIDAIADHLNNGRKECAMIELGALNEYIHLQAKNAMTFIPNNML